MRPHMWAAWFMLASVLGDRPKVYTFHTRVFDKQAKIQDNAEMLLLWARQWWSQGWDPQVLTLGHAKAHPLYWRMKTKTDGWPTINAKNYEQACFLRWLAYAQFVGDDSIALFVDYDLSALNLSDIPVAGNLTTWKGMDPMMVAANGRGLDKIIKAILDYELSPLDRYNWRPHISDMSLLRGVHKRQRLYEAVLPEPKAIRHFANKFHEKFCIDTRQTISRTDWMRLSLREGWKSKHRVRAPHGMLAELKEMVDHNLLSALGVKRQSNRVDHVIHFGHQSNRRAHFQGSYNLLRTSFELLEYHLGFTLLETRQQSDQAIRPLSEQDSILLARHAEIAPIEALIRRRHLPRK